jgi:hypothetical protein
MEAGNHKVGKFTEHIMLTLAYTYKLSPLEGSNFYNPVWEFIYDSLKQFQNDDPPVFTGRLPRKNVNPDGSPIR